VHAVTSNGRAERAWRVKDDNSMEPGAWSVEPVRGKAKGTARIFSNRRQQAAFAFALANDYGVTKGRGAGLFLGQTKEIVKL